MNRRQLGLLFVSTLIVIISAFSRNVNGQELALRPENKNVINAEETKLTAEDFLYVLKNTITTVPCILTNMSINVRVPYKTKSKTGVNKTLSVPHKARVDGRCSPVISEMKLIWKENNTDKENTIKFVFINDHENFSLFSVGLDIYLNETGDSFIATSDIDLHLFAASVTNEFYKCEREEKVTVGKAEIDIKNVSLIAFHKNDDMSALKEKQCSDEKDKTRAFPYVTRDENSRRICTLARMSISLKIPYKKKNMENGTAIIEVPTALNVSGTCDSSSGFSSVVLTWDPEVSKTESTFEKTNIKFYIQRDKMDSHVALITATIFVDNTHFKDAQNAGEFIQIFAQFGDLFSAPAENGVHSCPEKTFTTMTGVTVTIRNVLLVGFDAEQDFASKQVTDCRSTYFERDFTYIVRRNDTGVPCTLAKMSINATVLYKKGDSQNNRTLSVPPTAVVSGNCGNKSSEMTLSWLESDNNNTMNTITFHIGRSKTTFYVYQVTATVYYDQNDTATAIQGESYNMYDLFSASGINGLYNCTSLIQEIKVDDIHLNITDVTLIAFNTEEYLNPKNVTECSTNSGGDVTTTTESPKPPLAGYPYVVRDNKNIPCIAANMMISIKVPYAMKNTTNQTTLLVPTKNKENVKVNGACGNEISIMNLIWTENSEANSQYEYKENKVTINFVNDSSNYFIRSMNLFIYLDEHKFPGANATGTYINVTTEKLDIFSTPLNNVYKCSDKTSVNARNVVITISEVSLIAFNEAAQITSKSVNCAKNESTDSNTGAIVGGIIGGIILVGIIGYLGVMYKRKRGYGV